MRTHPLRGTLASATLVTASCVLLSGLFAGCSVPSPTSTDSSSGSGSPSPSSAPAATNPASGSPVSGSQASADFGPAVATRQVTLQGFQVALDLFPLRKESNYVTLNARLRVLKAPVSTPENPVVAPNSLLGNETSNILDQNAGGMRLTDAAHNVRYLPAESPDGKTLCTPRALPTSWDTGDAFTVSCLFGAPASSTVTVDAVTFGSIPNVPVQ